MFFDVNLFQLNGAPLKFHLDGYTHPDIKEIASIIEAFGGVLSSPGKDTITFSEPGLYTTGDRCRFHIKFIYDSIVQRKLQDLDNYKLPHGTNPTESNVLGEDIPAAETGVTHGTNTIESEHTDTDTEDENEPSNVEYDADEDSSSTDMESSFRRVKKVLKRRRSQVPQELCDVTIEDEPGHSRVLPETSRPADSSSTEPQKTRGLFPRTYTTQGKRYSEDDKRRIIQYLISKDAFSRIAGMTVWKDMEAANILVNPSRSAIALRQFFFKSLKPNIEKYTRDPKVLDQLKYHDLRNPSIRYTGTENQKIIDYLSKYNKIHRAGGLGVWREMEADKIFIDPPRSAVNLHAHFMLHLQYQYKNYNVNAQALRSFMQRDAKRHRRRLRKVMKTV